MASKSIFNPGDNKEIIDRMNKLTPRMKPQWGKMNPAQMLAHCIVPINVATGNATLNRNLMGILFGRFAKKSMVKDQPFRKNLPTDKSFIVKDEKNFDTEKEKLTNILKHLQAEGTSVLTKDPHPFFGELNTEEWDKLIWKHLDHHMRQFGV